MEIESEEFQDVDEDNTVQTKKKQQQNLKKDDIELLTPKVEPIDVDEHVPSNKDNKAPTKPATSISAPNLIEILNQPKTSQTMATSIAITNFSVPQSSCYTNTTTASTSNPMVVSSLTPSKISVVSPTILMPQTNQVTPTDAGHSSMPMRIGGNLQAFLTSSGARSTVTGANGMKFILVNTGDQRRPSTLGAQTVTMATSTLNANTANVNINQSLQSPQKITNQTQSRAQKSIQSPALKSTNGTSPVKKQLAAQLAEKGDVLRKKELSGMSMKAKPLYKNYI